MSRSKSKSKVSKRANKTKSDQYFAKQKKSNRIYFNKLTKEQQEQLLEQQRRLHTIISQSQVLNNDWGGSYFRVK